MDERLGRKIGEGGCSEVFEWVCGPRVPWMKCSVLNFDRANDSMPSSAIEKGELPRL
ncbi:hypothetical protein SAMN05444162_2189 [Paenibacillaceae bacterium GAS479]|nr:hypothetical protein SAMN05444162_2189 [Paenibacillaceae bacterium GAS479]